MRSCTLLHFAFMRHALDINSFVIVNTDNCRKFVTLCQISKWRRRRYQFSGKLWWASLSLSSMYTRASCFQPKFATWESEQPRCVLASAAWQRHTSVDRW